MGKEVDLPRPTLFVFNSNNMERKNWEGESEKSRSGILSEGMCRKRAGESERRKTRTVRERQTLVKERESKKVRGKAKT